MQHVFFLIDRNLFARRSPSPIVPPRLMKKTKRTPFGPANNSRLTACPVCLKHVHVLLAAAHVDAHFQEVSTQPFTATASLRASQSRPVSPELKSEDASEEPLGGLSAVEDGEGQLHADCAPAGVDLAASENHQSLNEGSACGLCCEPFAKAKARFVFWPCQHARACGECALKVWQQPKQRRRCPWCSGRLEVRPRPLKTFL